MEMIHKLMTKNLKFLRELMSCVGLKFIKSGLEAIFAYAVSIF